ncbi:ABC transporter ATP-binding protein [Bacillus coahuilensis p1.1.43]|uniref:ABC transporter ATP-binding protein n=1 Tax=Bacillus coahuilensis p1.1.43 TaxID=1150625 RepID=A0A147K7U4_9BACI|nr:ABC transporter ATP-binding protein [Bacillus coahuilensis]KUP06127.1 ABC transporter ATP-binding protein [Bacillus coahuilensis p1.1.43]
MSILLHAVNKTYQSGDVEVRALKDVEMLIKDKTISVILGPSGSGKSTLVNVIGGIDRADSGSVEVFGEDISGLNEKHLTKYRRDKIGFIFQSYNLISTLTVRENVEVGKEISKEPLNIDEVLEKVGMLDKKNKYPHQLSGGEQQRVAIARALVKNPKLLLCDEPTGALDEETGKKILTLLQDINKKYDTTVMIITHNPGLAAMAHVVLKMKSGEVLTVEENEHPIAAEQVKWV